MKITKKLLSLVLVLAFVIGNVSVSARENPYYEKNVMNTVTNLSLMPYANLDGDEKNLTRSQMVTSILLLMGIDSSVYPKPSEYKFSDVDYELPSAQDISVANSLGLINGVSNNEFAPDYAATLAQVVKVLISALGYEVKANAMGGYPSGYLSVASQLGILNGINAANDGMISHLTFAKLLYNALDAPLFERVVYGGTESYEQSSKTTLEKNLGFSKTKGVIIETEEVNLYGNQPTVPEGHIYLGSKLLKCGDTDIESYIGYTATAYFKESDNGTAPKIVFYMIEQYNNTEEFECDDILSFTHSGNTFFISYEGEKDKILKHSISSAACLYNGYSVAQSEISSLVMPRINGGENYRITLIDNNLDFNYEVVKIENYVSGVVKRVNTYLDIIYCYNFSDLAALSPIYLNPANDDEKPFDIFSVDGEEISLSDILPDSSIAIYENIQSTYRKIYVSNETVSGLVSEIDNNGYYLINGKNYKVSEVTGDNLGLTATFYLDIKGKIIGKKSGSDLLGGYGLLMNVYVGEGGLTNYPKLRILTPEGEMVDFSAENQIIAYNPYTDNVEKTAFTTLVNNSSTPAGYGGVYDYMIWHTDNASNFTYETKSNDYSKEFYWRPWLTEEDKSLAASRKPIYYEVNAEGRIKKILVPDIPTSENKITLLNNDGKYSFAYNSSLGTLLDQGASSSGRVPHYKVSVGATVFSVLALGYSESDYQVAPQGIAIIPNGAQRKMKLYSISGGSEAELIVSYSHLPYENIANMPYVVVDYVAKTSDGKTKLYGWANGQRYTGIIKPDTRLVEKIPNSSNTEYNDSTKVTASNILDYRNYASGGLGFAPYNIATSTSPELLEHPSLKIGVNTPYADETSLRRGDIILVGKNRGEDICYVEMAMRADTCLMLISHVQDDWYSRMSGSAGYFKGVVTSLSGYDEVYMRILGEYTGSVQRKTTEKPDFRQTAYFDDKNVPYDFTTCKYVWAYDYERNTIDVIDAHSINVGDVIIGRGAATAPKECIVLKNYPAEPEFSYWETE